jgi:hypothetical protein
VWLGRISSALESERGINRPKEDKDYFWPI